MISKDYAILEKEWSVRNEENYLIVQNYVKQLMMHPYYMDQEVLLSNCVNYQRKALNYLLGEYKESEYSELEYL